MSLTPYSNIDQYPILGLPVSAINMQDVLDVIHGWIQREESHYICCVPAHAVMDNYDHPELHKVYTESGLNTPDGMAIVWLLRRAGFKQVERVYGPDLMVEACAYGLDHGWRHYFYGGTPETVKRLADVLQERFPGLQITGIESPPFRALTPEEDEQAAIRINAARPDIVWVGLGSPKQEQWMHEHIKQLEVSVLAGVGAAFDFLSGTKPQAPRWVQRLGLEWFYRLVSEPRRLWKRYILGYPRFIWLIIKKMAGLKIRN